MNKNMFGRRLKELRTSKAKKLGKQMIRQREVAEYLNITPGAYGSWETGRTKPDIELLPKLADFFEVSIDYLLGYVAGGVTHVDTTSKMKLDWSLRWTRQKENERKGIEVWQRLVQGENLTDIEYALEARSKQELECYLLDIIYTDTINIHRLPLNTQLADQIQQKYDLREVVVVDMEAEWPPFFRYILLGEAARSYFKKHVTPGMTLGIAGGYSISRLIYSLRPGECESIECFPLATSPVVRTIDIDANSLVGVLSYRHSRHNVRGYSLPFASTRAMRDAEDPQQFAQTERILTKAKSVDIAFMGLGDFEERRRVPMNWLDELVDAGKLNIETLKEISVGDILYHFVDEDGNPVPSEIDDLTCSIRLKDLNRIVRWRLQAVVIASGKQKMKISVPAIKGKYANVFIIDNELAQVLLEAEG